MLESLHTTTNKLKSRPFPELYHRLWGSLPSSSVWFRLVPSLLVCFFSTALSPAFVQAQTKKPKVVITSPKVPSGTPIVVTGNVVYIKFAASNADVTHVKFRITTDEGDAGGFIARVLPDETKNARYVPLFKGANTIELFAISGDTTEKAPSAKLAVGCNDPSCYSALPPTIAEVSPGESPATRNVTISRPTGGDSVTDVATIARTISVQKTSGIKKLTVDVTNGDKTVDHKLVPLEDLNETLAYAKPTLKLAPGKNVIRVYNLETLGEKGNQDSVEVTLTCSDAKCGKEAEGATSDESATKSDVKILQPTQGFDAGDVSDFVPYLSIAKDNTISKLQYEVFQDGQRRAGGTLNIPAHAGKEATLTPKIKLWKGSNTIRFFDPADPANTESQAAIKVTCSGDTKCLKPDSKPAEEVAKTITIDVPATKVGDTYQVTDKSSLDSMVTVAKSQIKKIQYDVISSGKPIFTSDPVPVNATEKEHKLPLRLKFVRGLNTIRIYDAENPGSDDDASVMIDCTGENCASDLDIATIVTNNQNTRIIVGLEQAGGSSAESKTSPFLDLFFTTPFWYNRMKQKTLVRALDASGQPLKDRDGNPVFVSRSDDGPWVRALDASGQPLTDQDGNPLFIEGSSHNGIKVPRLGFWGQIRLASTPEQLTTAGVFPTALASQLTQSGTTAKLVQSFDFLAGLEARIFTGNGTFLSLIPGIRQKTRFYISAGYGAISPLDATKENTKFFLIPDTTSSQRALFEERYGIPPPAATHLALVPLERDRFYRQWYAGLRLQTFFCERETEIDRDCSHFRNSFPAITDFMIGQSQSVTGGSFKRSVLDADGNSRTKQSFVFKVDAYYPLPFREANFIYFYGTAIMKLGGDVRVDNPLILDAATSIPPINDPTVYIPEVGFLRSQQPNRDYYKIGIGINLTDLFNRNKPR